MRTDVSSVALRSTLILLLLAVQMPGATGSSSSPPGPPVNVILDSDIGPDCDDAGAVALLHALSDRGEANILAMMCCTSSEWGAPCLDALNTYYGRPNIPVGTLKDAGFLLDSSYNRLVAERYPHRIRNGRDAPDATVLYRQVLARQPGKSVAVVAIGPLRNLARLLESEPDQHSPLGGRDLVAAKVALLSCMGGWNPAVPKGCGPEWNLAQDEKASRSVAENWPTPILFSGAEIGSGIMTGRRVALDCPLYNPLAMAIGLYVGYGRDRESWDQTVALVAVRGLRDYWKSTPSGTNRIGDKGANTFTTGEDRGHRYLVRSMPIPQLEDVIEDLMASAKGGPTTLDFDIAFYCKDGFGTATAKDSQNGPDAAKQAFDRRADTAWIAKTPDSWIQYQCPDGRNCAASRYRITSWRGQNDPKNWVLLGSNDSGASWVTLDTRSNEIFAARGQAREFTCGNSAPFNLYRLQFSGGPLVEIAEIGLLERIESVAGVDVADLKLDQTMLSLPVAGRATLNASVLPANALDKSVTWVSSDPPVATVKRIGRNHAVVFGIGTGTCTVNAVTRDGQKTAACQVTVTPSTLPPLWVYEEVNSPHVPGCAIYRDGTFAITGGGMAIQRWWLRVWDQFALVSQRTPGDCAITARVATQTVSSPEAMAGLMFRETLARDSRFVMLGISPNRELFLTWRHGPNDEGPRLKLGKYELPIYLKLERQGSNFTAYASRDGVSWGKPLGSHAGELSREPIRAGLCVTAHNNPTTSTATFDHVNLAPNQP